MKRGPEKEVQARQLLVSFKNARYLQHLVSTAWTDTLIMHAASALIVLYLTLFSQIILTIRENIQTLIILNKLHV